MASEGWKSVQIREPIYNKISDMVTSKSNPSITNISQFIDLAVREKLESAQIRTHIREKIKAAIDLQLDPTITNTSQFIEMALLEKLERMKVPVRGHWIYDTGAKVETAEGVK